MRFAMTLAAALIVISGPHHHHRPHPARSHAAGPAPGALFTLAGAGTDDDALATGRPAAVAPLEDPSQVTALADGSFLVGTEGVVWRVDGQGRLQRMAGQP